MTLTDQVIVVLAALLIGALYALLWRPGGEAGELSVWVSGEERMRLPLSDERRIEVSGAIGLSVIEIRAGRARVVESPGPRRICERMGWIAQPGESAVCLPNQVIIRIEADDPRFDAMSF